MNTRHVLITGGDGYLGLRLARKYLELTEKSLLLWMRARDEREFQTKKEKLRHQLGPLEGRVSYHWGDLAQERPFHSIDPRTIQAILHTAAVTRFNVDERTARKVNIEGTEKLLHFADRCPSLEGVGLLSTVYASGLRSGVIEELPLDDKDGFANPYERSKWAAEAKLLTQFDRLPWRIFRVATIISDDEAGSVTRQNAFHNTLKLFYYGLLSLVPGRPETPLYFVTGEFAACAIFNLMNSPANQAIYHVAHTRGESLSLGELIDLGFEAFEREKDFTSRRILKPLYADAESFDLLAEGARAFGGGVLDQAISSVAPFARQLFVQKDLRNSKLVLALTQTSGACGYRAPDPRRLVRNTCEYLVRTRWGKSINEPESTLSPPAATSDERRSPR